MHQAMQAVPELFGSSPSSPVTVSSSGSIPKTMMPPSPVANAATVLNIPRFYPGSAGSWRLYLKLRPLPRSQKRRHVSPRIGRNSDIHPGTRQITCPSRPRIDRAIAQPPSAVLKPQPGMLGQPSVQGERHFPGLLTGCEARPVTPNSSSSQPSRLVPCTSAVSRVAVTWTRPSQPASRITRSVARSVGGLCAPVNEKSPSKNARHAPSGSGNDGHDSPTTTY